MKTKLLRKLRHKYFDLYAIKYSHEKEEWELYVRDTDMFDNIHLDCICSRKKLPDIQTRLREKVQNRIKKYLQENRKNSSDPNKYLW